MEIEQIPLEQISTSSSILNRGGESAIVSDISFLKLVMSIKTLKALIHPITIRKTGGATYEVITGNRRFLAFKNLYSNGELPLYRTIPSVILDLDDKTAHLYTHHENQFRTNPSTIESFELKVSIVPFLFDKGTGGEANENFKLGMEILQKYIAFLMSITKKETGEKAAEKFERLKAVSGSDDPDKILRMFFSNLGESPRYFWEKRKLFEYDQDIFVLYSSRKITFRLAKNMNNELNKKTPGVRELIVQSIESDDTTPNDIASKLTSLALLDEKKKVVVGTDIVEKRISTFRKINKMLKSENKIFTEDMIADIDKHISKIQDIIKGT